MEFLSDDWALALIGLLGGVLLGLAARLGRFCTLGAVEDFYYQGNDRRLKMWFLAIAVAGLLNALFVALGLLDLSTTLYHLAPWSPLVAIIGGLMFGYGMALAGNCGFGALARFGGGDLRAFVIVLVMGIAAYVALSGPLAAFRVIVTDLSALPVASRTLPELGAAHLGLPDWAGIAILSTALALYALRSTALRASPKGLFWAALVGLAITSGWVGTHWIAQNGFSQTQTFSHTYTAPLGETILFLMTSSGGGLSFGVGSVIGVLAGAFAGSLIKGHFRWEACEDPRELGRQVLGASLMGVGAVFALGCTIGQGISAMSIWTYSAPLVLAAIIFGARLGLRHLIEGFGRTHGA
ncbi:YeeE/YedE family protein [Nereida sp. MMG025]|uniref:YeeE/YedE family protein n=1 Tax=Nereida sp. MMG025 TaxID=2909981 RepID=UPI001F464C26|nr:YeeE/YedE family protein [Nereida sp. MMG025]MCF6443690.1 YeeE/YedE family protein [Nereida sp. MMG025]